MFDSQKKTREKIRISREAWAGTMDKASPGQIVNIELLPAPSFWTRFRRARSEEPPHSGPSLTGELEGSSLLPSNEGNESTVLSEKKTDDNDTNSLG